MQHIYIYIYYALVAFCNPNFTYRSLIYVNVESQIFRKIWMINIWWKNILDKRCFIKIKKLIISINKFSIDEVHIKVNFNFLNGTIWIIFIV